MKYRSHSVGELKLVAWEVFAKGRVDVKEERRRGGWWEMIAWGVSVMGLMGVGGWKGMWKGMWK